MVYWEIYYCEVFFVLSVFSLFVWEKFLKFYMVMFIKLFVIGFKVGYGFCIDEVWLKKMLYVKGYYDFGIVNFN